jgi:hypothetical protein
VEPSAPFKFWALFGFFSEHNTDAFGGQQIPGSRCLWSESRLLRAKESPALSKQSQKEILSGLRRALHASIGCHSKVALEGFVGLEFSVRGRRVENLTSRIATSARLCGFAQERAEQFELAARLPRLLSLGNRLT